MTAEDHAKWYASGAGYDQDEIVELREAAHRAQRAADLVRDSHANMRQLVRDGKVDMERYFDFCDGAIRTVCEALHSSQTMILIAVEGWQEFIKPAAPPTTIEDFIAGFRNSDGGDT